MSLAASIRSSSWPSAAVLRPLKWPGESSGIGIGRGRGALREGGGNYEKNGSLPQKEDSMGEAMKINQYAQIRVLLGSLHLPRASNPGVKHVKCSSLGLRVIPNPEALPGGAGGVLEPALVASASATTQRGGSVLCLPRAVCAVLAGSSASLGYGDNNISDLLP